MMLMTNAPVELYDEVGVGPASTGDGEMLAHLDEVPAGAWLAGVLEIGRPSPSPSRMVMTSR